MGINDIQNALMTQYQEREEVIEGLILALVARQHVLLIGPPGTGKSALVADLAKRITGANYFQWLLTRFSTPEELFGPVSLKELEQGVYKRNTAGKLPEAHLAFLDEIFKANSAILNSLLTLINERLFYNNGQPVRTPLVTLIGASNEYPEEGEGLEALFDRFLLRFEVNYIGEEQSFLSMLKDCQPVQADMTLEELFEVQFFSDMVAIPEEVYEAMVTIRRELKNEGINPSDRRFKQSLDLVRAKALLAGRNQATVEDLVVLKDCLWEEPGQKEKAASIVKRNSMNPLKLAMQEIANEAMDILKNVKSNPTAEQAVEATAKLKFLMKEIEKLKQRYPGRSEIDKLEQEIRCLNQKIAETALGIGGEEQHEQHGEAIGSKKH